MVCCHSDPLQLSESQWNHYIWEVCSANRWDAQKIAMPAAGIGQQKVSSSPWTPNCMSHNQYSKSWTNWSMKFGLICHICMTYPQLLTLLQASEQLFAGKMLLQPAEGRKFFPSVHQIPKRGYLCYRNKQTYFLLANCVDYNDSYFD